MRTAKFWLSAATVAAIFPLLTVAQPAPPDGNTRVDIKAVSYQMGTSSKVDLKPPSVASQAYGEAKIEAKRGATSIEANVDDMPEPSSFGAEFLTYIVWVVSPDGRTNNVGEIEIDQSGKGKLKATT